MPGFDVRSVQSGTRSSLYITKTGVMFRQYHDTKKWDGPLHTSQDDCGVERCSGRQRVEELRDEAWGAKRRGTRGAPAHLMNARDVLNESPNSIRVVADRCGVKTSTAWSYVTKAVDIWPQLHVQARRLIFPGLLQGCCHDDVCVDGSLVDVMQCIKMKTGVATAKEWQSVEDPYAHLRLARLCLQAEHRIRE